MIKKFNNQDDLAKDLALFILTKIKGKKIFVLGCPGGRSLKKTYYYLGVLSSKLKISLDHLIIIMMDILTYGQIILKEKMIYFSI